MVASVICMVVSVICMVASVICMVVHAVCWGQCSMLLLLMSVGNNVS